MMRSFQRWTTRLVAVAALAAAAVGGDVVFGQGRAAAPAAGSAPGYRVIATWPQPFHDDSWVFGSITGVTVDAQNHVWVAHRGADSLENNMKGMMLSPPTSTLCCIAAPPILEFDAAGALVSSWGGPSAGYQWPQVPGGIAVDTKGNVWVTAAGFEPAPPGGGAARGRRGGVIPPDDPTEAPAAAAGRAAAPTPPAAAPAPAAGAARGAGAGRGAGGRGAAAAPEPGATGPADAHVLKFSRTGRYLLTIGTPGKMDGPASQNTLNRPDAVTYDAAANEVFIADSGNHRIVVFDADSGVYKRHWFAYGDKTGGADPGPYDPAAAAPSRSFRDVTCVEIAKDGMVYVCDRTSNRIQVFDKSGKFIKEVVVAKATEGATVALGAGASAIISVRGSVWDVAFSNDPAERYLFVADGVNKKVRILERATLTEVGSFGSGGRYPGQFLAVSNIATDAAGNVYAGETHHGQRVQKFVPVR